MARFNVTIDKDKVPGDLTDFPVYVNLADMPAGFWSTVKSGGGDIRCYKSDGTTELPREVVSCNTTDDEGELHVKHSGTLSSSTDTVIIIDVDGTRDDYDATDTYGRNAVWSDYEAVNHLGSTTDSTGNGLSLTNTATVDDEGGKVGDAYGYRGENTSNSQWATNSFNFTGNFSVTTWIKFANTASADESIFHNYIFDTNNRGYYMRRKSDGKVRFEIDTPDPSLIESTGTIGTAWTYVCFTRTKATNGHKIYINGSNDGQKTTSDDISYGTTHYPTLGVARSTAFTYGTPMEGIQDEVRVREAELSANWITTEYNNQNSPTTFYTVTVNTDPIPTSGDTTPFLMFM